MGKVKVKKSQPSTGGEEKRGGGEAACPKLEKAAAGGPQARGGEGPGGAKPVDGGYAGGAGRYQYDTYFSIPFHTHQYPLVPFSISRPRRARVRTCLGGTIDLNSGSEPCTASILRTYVGDLKGRGRPQPNPVAWPVSSPFRGSLPRLENVALTVRHFLGISAPMCTGVDGETTVIYHGTETAETEGKGLGFGRANLEGWVWVCGRSSGTLPGCHLVWHPPRRREGAPSARAREGAWTRDTESQSEGREAEHPKTPPWRWQSAPSPRTRGPAAERAGPG